MPVGDAKPLSRDNLLWEPATVLHYLVRDEPYGRLRTRPLSGIPTLSAQAYADVLVTLRLRRLAPDKLALNMEELAAFHVAELDRPLAESYSNAYSLCLNGSRNRGLDVPEPWFVWNVALNHAFGCRILTNDRPRYAGIVPQDDLV